jgi:hypothetical protein
MWWRSRSIIGERGTRIGQGGARSGGGECRGQCLRMRLRADHQLHQTRRTPGLRAVHQPRSARVSTNPVLRAGRRCGPRGSVAMRRRQCRCCEFREGYACDLRRNAGVSGRRTGAPPPQRALWLNRAWRFDAVVTSSKHLDHGMVIDGWDSCTREHSTLKSLRNGCYRTEGRPQGP